MRMIENLRIATRRQIGAAVLPIFLAAFLAAPLGAASHAGSDLDKTELPKPVTESLVYILGLLENGEKPDFQAGRVSRLIDFVVSGDKPWPALYHSNDDLGPESAYHEFEIDQNLGEIIEYAYSPAIPSQAMVPSSLRVSYWKNFNGKAKSDAWFWNYPLAEGDIQIARGVEHEETTPDIFSGTYYCYDLDRLLILGRHNGRNVFFSVSRQKEKSPGKKAFALGDDQDWNYLYTDETGVNKMGMGWVKPYMYASFSVTVFIEQATEKPSVKCAMFKWLSAGAAGMNMVGTGHIHA